MIKAAVFSDTHGNTFPMLEAARASGADVLIHLGDHDRDALLLRKALPDTPLYSVCGNCDYAPLSPSTMTVQLGPVKAFLTHGHLYNVSPWHMDSLVYAAEELGGVTLINPGTAGRGAILTWALVTIFNNGAISCEFHELK